MGEKMKLKPEIIAWTNGFTVIPFENVLSVIEDDTVEGQILVYLDSKRIPSNGVVIGRDNAQAFVDKYNLYLAAVEGITLDSKEIPEAGAQS
jgi:hypothetical protein